MTQEEVFMSNQLKKRFVKDTNLPITVFDNPFFSQRLGILNELFGAETLFEVFCESVEPFANEQDYFEYYNSIKDAIISHIKGNSAFNDFQSMSFAPIENIPSKKNLYTDENDGKVFVSIDMNKANFTALRHYNPIIFDNCETWEQFVEQFTDNEHIIHSKYIRQVILGACNPGRQIKYEHYLMSLVAKNIQQTHTNYDIFSVGEDEILIKLSDDFSSNDCSKVISEIKECVDTVGISAKINIFKLENFKSGWAKYSLSNTEWLPSFKCVDAEIFHQIVLHYMKKPIQLDDLIFYHNGKLARFLEEVENPWKK